MESFEDEYKEIYNITGATVPTITLGRSRSCEVTIPPVNSPYSNPKKPHQIYGRVSRKHARFNPQTGMIEDAGSRGGTFVNDEKLAEGQKRLLKDGDLVRLGKLKLMYINHTSTKNY